MSFLSSLYAPKRPEPSYPRLPAVDDRDQTTVRGIYAVGEVAGTPLIKLGLNAGHDLVHRLANELRDETRDATDPEIHDLIIMGAGSSGLGAAAAAKDLGLRAVVLEANHLAETVYTMTKGKVIFAEPLDVPKKGRIWFEECTREELLDKWERQVRELDLDLRCFEKVLDVQRQGSLLEVTSDKAKYRCRRFILAAGKSGNPRKAGVPGEIEHAAKIDHRLIDPDLHSNQDILVYGGGDVALEAAISLSENNQVTLITIDKEFTYPKKRNVDALLSLARDGKLSVHMDSSLAEITAAQVTYVDHSDGGRRASIPNDHVFEMIGAELPLGFFAKVGIKLENTWTWQRWALLAGIFLFVYSLYAIKSYGKGMVAWPFESLISPETYTSTLRSLFELAFWPFHFAFTEEAYQTILNDQSHSTGFQQGYLYSLLYTVIMVVFGYQAMLRWRGIARKKQHQTNRYLSLIGFQVAFFLIVNIVAVQAFSLQHAWRAWGLYQPFPLFFNTFFWWDTSPGNESMGVFWFFVTAGLIGTFVVIPFLSWKHGKRFCTWVCGCGGLAETLGDRWRHLSPKGERSRSWEFQAVAIMLAAFMVGIIVVGAYNMSGSNIWWHTYNYLVDFWLVAVIPITLYPFFGGKVWCRYWCPLAAWNGVLSKWFGRLRIKSNDQCISCTQCSKYCQVGVDVMAFAKNQTSFDNQNSACIHCGICIDVCPMDVLSFDSSPRSPGQEKETIDRG
ncbi:MAG: NAD(P)-binding domain-containing protein [Planctomycetota bacterium]